MPATLPSAVPRVSAPLLRGAREDAGLRRETVAEALKPRLSYNAIQAYERGVVVPPGNVLVQLAAMYGVTVESLCEVEDGQR